MNKKVLLSLLVIPFLAFPASAQEFNWNVDFEYFFHNTEFDRSYYVSSYSESSNAARLTPSVGVAFKSRADVTQSIMLGVDVVRDMGYGVRNTELIGDLTLYYSADIGFRNESGLSFIAGAFPRSFAEGDYRRLFWDYDNAFYDPNFEGFFVKYHSDKFYAELGLDWFGKKIIPEGPWNRDHFQVISSGKWQVRRPLALGWTAKAVHYADFHDIERLVDQDMMSAWVLWTPRVRRLDVLEAEAALIASYQADRGASAVMFPCGVQLRQKLSRYGFGAENFLYAGTDLQPYRDSYDADLYPSDRAYHLPTPLGASATLGWNDELQLFYSPEIAPGLHLSITLGFQFASPMQWLSPIDGNTYDLPLYRGCRQMLTLRADLGKHKSKQRVVGNRDSNARERNLFDEFLHRLYEM